MAGDFEELSRREREREGERAAVARIRRKGKRIPPRGTRTADCRSQWTAMKRLPKKWLRRQQLQQRRQPQPLSREARQEGRRGSRTHHWIQRIGT